jgi:hypothetical protein
LAGPVWRASSAQDLNTLLDCSREEHRRQDQMRRSLASILRDSVTMSLLGEDSVATGLRGDEAYRDSVLTRSYALRTGRWRGDGVEKDQNISSCHCEQAAMGGVSYL